MPRLIWVFAGRACLFAAFGSYLKQEYMLLSFAFPKLIDLDAGWPLTKASLIHGQDQMFKLLSYPATLVSHFGICIIQQANRL